MFHLVSIQVVKLRNCRCGCDRCNRRWKSMPANTTRQWRHTAHTIAPKMSPVLLLPLLNIHSTRTAASHPLPPLPFILILSTRVGWKVSDFQTPNLRIAGLRHTPQMASLCQQADHFHHARASHHVYSPPPASRKVRMVAIPRLAERCVPAGKMPRKVAHAL